jgi:beta-lactam-binding protein with PASTA domain
VATIALARDLGPDTSVVPTVVGLPRTMAEARIRAAGFVAAAERRGRARRRDVVVRQQPRPGATLSRGSIVRITLSGER